MKIDITLYGPKVSNVQFGHSKLYGPKLLTLGP